MSIENIKTYDDLLLEAKEAKYNQIWSESDKRNLNAESQFNTGNSHTHVRTNDKLNKKNQRIGNKKHKNLPISTEEEEFIDNFDDMVDWQDGTDDVADNAEDTIEAMTDIDTVNAYDVVNTPTWQTPFTL